MRIHSQSMPISEALQQRIKRFSIYLLIGSILSILLFSLVVVAFNPKDILPHLDLSDFIRTKGIKHVTLLAVHETANGYSGSLADISLELRHGTGRIFLDTFPLSKIDTQISTRYAKEIACKYVGQDCPSDDFIYTIRSDSSIVGGPSAGGAIAVLTVAMLKNLNLDPKVAMTGTINSGGIIGPVSGIKYKIDIAAQNGFEKVLIPMDSTITDLENNISYSAEEYADTVGIEVIPISDLNDAIFEFTGVNLNAGEINIELPDTYEQTMMTVANLICNRSTTLYQIMKDQFEITSFDPEAQKLSENLEDEAINLTARAEAAKDAGYYYSAASFCYGANIKYSNVILLQRNQAGTTLADMIKEMDGNINDFELALDNASFETLTDFEVYMIIRERVEAARDYLNNAELYASENATRFSSYYNLAYSLERLYTSSVWSNFFGMGGKPMSISQDDMNIACVNKLSEAQERFQYVKLFFPEAALADIANDISRALNNHKNKNYALCIAKATRAKANTNVLLNMMTSSQEQFERLLNRKLEATRNVIIQQQEKNVFPILGYSYYEYSTSLEQVDPLSAMIYTEYALELSWLDIYFEKESSGPLFYFNPSYMIMFFIGFILGATAIVAILPRRSRFFRRSKRLHK